ncbi:MAG: CshA/CshB family fibrillar adhesin-related protein [Actinomycetota bacterium]
MRTRTSAPRRSKRATVAVLVLGVLAGLLVPLAPLSPAPAAQAVRATGGTGQFVPAIEWVSWGSHGAAVSSGARGSASSAGIDVSCTLSSLAGSLVATRPGTAWGASGFNSMYFTGAAGVGNLLDVGLQTAQQNTTVTFNVSCSATSAGAAVPLAGIVFADAEQSGGTEMVGATAPNDRWQIIDRHRSAGCAESTIATRPGRTPARLQLTATGACPTGPAAIAFATGSTSLSNVTLRGGGLSAIALGVMLPLDFGDAPERYGTAGAVLQPGWSGGEPATGGYCGLFICGDGVSDVFQSALATSTASAPRLGALVDAEAAYPIGSAGSGDDVVGDDEDSAFTYTSIGGQQVTGAGALDLPAAPSSVQTVAVSCVGAGAAVRAWLDFDRSGSFDADEQSSSSTCASSGLATLSWTVPADVKPASAEDPTYLRIRIANAGTFLGATGMTTSGEVEDHPVALAAPAIAATKSSNVTAGAVVIPEQRVTYTVTLRNTGRTELRNPTITDDMTAVLPGATFVTGSASVTPSGGVITPPSTTAPNQLRWSSATPVAIGQSIVLTYQVQVTAARRGQLLTNTATVTGVGPGAPSPVTQSASAQTGVAVTVSVVKEWLVDGIRYQHANRPAGLDATLSLSGPSTAAATAQAWGAPRDGYARNASVTIANTTTIAAGALCTIGASTIASSSTAQPLPASGATLSLPGATNSFTITTTVSCQSRLTLVNQVHYGSAAPSAWALRATGPDGSGLSGPTGVTGLVRAATAYVLSQTGGPATYVAQGTACVDVATGQAVVVTDSSVQVPAGKHVRCTSTQATAQLTILKHIEAATGGTLQASMFRLTAAPGAPTLTGLSATTVTGSETEIAAGSGANRFDVRPGHMYALTETSSYASLGLRVERLVDGRWETVADPAAIQISAGEHHTYRFVNAPVPVLTLPLTGGIGSDAFIFGGSALLLLAAALLLIRHRMRRPEAPLT